MVHWPIILIGPMGAGKTTIGEMLAHKLGAAHLELDDRRWDYYREIGYDPAHAAQLRAEGGFSALYQYWKPFEIHAVERVLADYSTGVISFGAGHSVYEDEALFERARRALERYANVILLLPCADLDEAAAVLKDRFAEVGRAEGFEPSPQTLGMIDHFLRHPSNRRLAKRVVYTAGKTPEQTCAEIIQGLGEISNIQIVKLTPDEWQLYKEIRLESLREEPQAFASSYADTLQRPAAFWQGRLSEAQAGEKSWLLFAKENDRLIGMIGAYCPEEHDEVEIISVYVSKEKRGHGAGAALMAAILTEVEKGHAFRKAILSVNKEQTAAAALYRKFGFQIVGEKSGLQGDGLLHTGYVMEKELRVG